MCVRASAQCTYGSDAITVLAASWPWPCSVVAAVVVAIVVVTAVIKFNDIMIARIHNQTHIWCGHAALPENTLFARGQSWPFVFMLYGDDGSCRRTRTALAPALAHVLRQKVCVCVFFAVITCSQEILTPFRTCSVVEVVW